MAVDFKGFNKLKEKLRKIQSPLKRQDLIDLGEALVERMRKVLRSGKSPITGRNLRKLSASYIKQRKSYKKRGARTSTFFKPSKSNLTVSGQLLDAIFFKVQTRERDILFGVKGTKRRKVFPRSKTRSISNAEVAEFLEDDRREFIGIDNDGLKSIIDLMLKNIRKAKRR